jgi:hypothetical protein
MKTLVLVGGLAALLGGSKPPKGPYVVPPGEAAGVVVARLSYVEGGVERAAFGRDFQGVSEGSEIKTGDRLRTGTGSVARLAFPSMTLTLAPSTQVSIPAGFVLSLALERGRAELVAEGDIIKLRTDEGTIRGAGRLVARRASGGPTAASVLDGHFVVSGSGGDVALERGQGTVIGVKSAPAVARPLLAAPTALVPGADALYVRPRAPASLSWTSSAGAYHVQLLGIDSEDVLLERDVGPPPTTLEIPWLGTFRWRVSVRGEDGLEGRPSGEGVLCIVEE